MAALSKPGAGATRLPSGPDLLRDPLLNKGTAFSGP